MYDENVTCRYLIVQGINLLRLRKCRVGMSNHIPLFYVGMIIHPATVALERDGVSNHQPHDCLLNGLFRRRSKKTSKLRVTGLAGRSPVTGEFPAQSTSNAENVSIWWRHHGIRGPRYVTNVDLPFSGFHCQSHENNFLARAQAAILHNWFANYIY